MDSRSFCNDPKVQEEDEIMTDERQVKILLVDDEIFNLILLENLVTTCFPNVVIDKALNGKIALEMVLQQDAENSPFEVIFTDIGMPEMDGFESSEKMIQSFKTGKLKVQPYIIAITAFTSEKVKEKAYKIGMQKFLTKPAKMQRVQEIVIQYLNQRDSGKNKPNIQLR